MITETNEEDKFIKSPLNGAFFNKMGKSNYASGKKQSFNPQGNVVMVGGQAMVPVNGNGQEPTKHSGAKFIAEATNGKPCVSAWNYSKKRGLVNLIASPYTPKGKSKPTVSVSKSGTEFETWIASITNKTLMTPPTVVTCLFNYAEKKLYIPKFNLVASCKSRRGGYFGRISND